MLFLCLLCGEHFTIASSTLINWRMNIFYIVSGIGCQVSSAGFVSLESTKTYAEEIHEG